MICVTHYLEKVELLPHESVHPQPYLILDLRPLLLPNHVNVVALSLIAALVLVAPNVCKDRFELGLRIPLWFLTNIR